MKFSVSNIALPSYDHEKELYCLSDMGFDGLEVAPSKVWNDTLNVSFSETESYRRLIEKAGLKVVGLHSLFFDQPSLGLFRGAEVRKETLQFLTHLSKICSDLGGKTMVYGSPAARRREDLPIDQADEEAISFFSELSPMIESHKTCVVIEPLGESETDYIYTLRHAMKLVHAVDRNELRNHMDAKAIVAAGEDNLEVFEETAPTLEHFHANDPGLGILGETSEVDHSNMGALLRKINYQGYVSIEQRMVDPNDPIGPIQSSYNVLNECYS